MTRTISGAARVVGIMGWPVSHSLSPRLHGFWLNLHDIDGAYVPLAVPPQDFVAVLKMLPKLGFVGANVTVPHKEAALIGLDSVSDTAKRIGAVNTVVVHDGGLLHGTNTDSYGFLENLRQGAPNWVPASGPAVVIGAGGAGRAVCAALTEAGTPVVRLVNRNKDRADTVARDLGGGIEPLPWTDLPKALHDAVLLVNATTLGMTGHPPLEVDVTLLPETAVVTDVVYVPLRTSLLVAAAARGLHTVDGLGMLLHQAQPGFAAWFNTEPVVTDALRAHVLAGLGT